jgi:hypothetical protein
MEGGFDLRRRRWGLESGLLGAVFDVALGFLDFFVEGVVVGLAGGFVLGGAVGEVAVGGGDAAGALLVGVVVVAELGVDAELAELVEDGVKAGLKAVVEGLESG